MSRWSQALLVASPGLIVLLAGAFHVLALKEPIESPAILTVGNTLFLGGIGLFTAVLALQTARRASGQGITLLGCGALVLGLIGLLVGPRIVNVNAAITVFNSGALAAGVLFLLAALRARFMSTDENRPSGHSVGTIAAAYGAAFGFVVLVLLAADRGVLPPFYHPGVGSTSLRNVVLGLAVAAFLSAGAVVAGGYRRSRMPFAAWLGAALVLIGIGLALALTSVPGSPAGWAGRAAQWMGAVYLLAAILSAQQRYGAYTLPLQAALLESERRLQLALDAGQIGVFEYDEANGQLEVNELMARQLRLASPGRLDARQLLSVLSPEEHDRFAASVRAVLDGRQPNLQLELRLADEAGEERWLLTRAESVTGTSGQRHLLGVSIDVSEQRRIDLRQRKRVRLSETLAAIDALVHSTLSLNEVLEEVLREAVNALACESAIVLLRDTESTRWRVASLHGPPRKADWLDNHVFPLATVCEQRQALATTDDLGKRSHPGFQPDEDVRFGLCVPLLLAEHFVGVLTFRHHGHESRFDELERDFCSKLATSISLALTNARLYEEQRNLARQLQEHFQHDLPAISGLDVAVAQELAHAPELVGGDFHDVFVREDGTVVILLGDVEGKGVSAAGLTETVRSAVRALALVTASPAEMLATVNRVLLAKPAGQYVTALLMVFDTGTGNGMMASAGHPAPLFVEDENVRYLEPSYHLPLGVLPGEYENSPFALNLGATMVLYTDGLTEARHHGELFGEARLLQAVRQLRRREPRHLASALISAAQEFAEDVRDDMQVLAIRFMAQSERTDAITPVETSAG